MERNFREDVPIDKNNLDEEVIRQPELYAYWAEKLPEAVKIRDKKKLQVDIVIAEIDQEIRKKILENKEKLTETAIKGLVLTDQRHIDIQDEYLDIKKDVSIIEIAKVAFEQRKSMLSKLCELYHSDYFVRVTTQFNKDSIATRVSETKIEDIRKIIADKSNKD